MILYPASPEASFFLFARIPFLGYVKVGEAKGDLKHGIYLELGVDGLEQWLSGCVGLKLECKGLRVYAHGKTLGNPLEIAFTLFSSKIDQPCLLSRPDTPNSPEMVTSIASVVSVPTEVHEVHEVQEIQSPLPQSPNTNSGLQLSSMDRASDVDLTLSPIINTEREASLTPTISCSVVPEPVPASDTDLVGTEKGVRAFRLLIQSDIVKVVVNHALVLFQAALLCDNPFPDSSEAEEMAKIALLKAAESGGQATYPMLLRMQQEGDYLQFLQHVVGNRTNSLVCRADEHSYRSLTVLVHIRQNCAIARTCLLLRSATSLQLMARTATQKPCKRSFMTTRGSSS
jgi:hypothetical protein